MDTLAKRKTVIADQNKLLIKLYEEKMKQTDIAI